MRVEIEHLSSVVRVSLTHPNRGEPYDVAFTARWLRHDAVELIGLDKPITKAMWNPIFDAFRAIGVAEIHYTRFTCGSERHRVKYTAPRKERRTALPESAS